MPVFMVWKKTYNKHSINGGISKYIAQILKMRQRYPLSILLFKTVLEALASVIKQENEMDDIRLIR